MSEKVEGEMEREREGDDVQRELAVQVIINVDLNRLGVCDGKRLRPGY